VKRPSGRKTTVLVVVSLLLAGIGAFTACSQQKEGEICNFANGNDDCDTDNNLACYEARTLNNTTSDRCCPIDRSKSTHPACVIPVGVVTADASAPADTGPPAVTTSDAATTTDAADAADQ
jgi:hypothetical protein